jgi:hypothetical protein
MELGFDLFVRESKSVTLTAARRSFLKGPKENTGNGRNQCGSVAEPLLRDVKIANNTTLAFLLLAGVPRSARLGAFPHADHSWVVSGPDGALANPPYEGT